MKKKFSKSLDMSEFNRTIHWRKEIALDQKKQAKKFFKLTKKITSCPICTGNRRKLFVDIYGYPYFECEECNHLYCGTPPSDTELKKLYSSVVNETVESSQGKIYIDHDLFDKRVKKIASPKAEFATDLIDDRGIWIDIGAGVGDLVIAANHMGWEAMGYESDREEVLFGLSKGAKIKHKFIDFDSDFNFLSSAKIVSMINVLEHLSNPKQAVYNIAKSLKSNSFFLFEVPRFPSISALTNRCFPDYAARNIYSPDHLHLFSDKSAHIMIENANLDVVSTWFFGQDIYELFGNILTYGNFENHYLIEKSHKIINELQQSIDKNELSDTMLVLTKKK